MSSLEKREAQFSGVQERGHALVMAGHPAEQTVEAYLAAMQVNYYFINPFLTTVPTFAVRETASLGIMGAPRVPPLNPSESIVLSKHYRL